MAHAEGKITVARPVQEVFDFIFNEGYTSYQGDDLVRRDICVEAIRLCSLLAGHGMTKQPNVHALLALMLLQASRLSTRVDAEGNLLLLAEQNRSQWDRRAIQAGLYHLEQAAAGDALTEFHLQAGIAACHAVAESYEATNWKRILFYYDSLVLINQSPSIALNRAVAVAMLKGPQAGIAALDEVKNLSQLKRYYLLPATFGELYQRLGEREQAAVYYREALDLMANEAERRFLLRKLESCHAQL